MMKIFGVVEYNGTKYQGWQKQVGAKTIQHEMEKVISKVLNTPTVVFGSGRTDAGVHALAQTFHFSTEKEHLDLNLLMHSFNCLLPEDIQIISLQFVNKDFHARLSAKAKIYEYRIHIGKTSVFSYDFEEEVFLPFDKELFKQALALFIGEHNFQNFTSKEDDDDDFVREIYSIRVITDEKNIRVEFKGDGFMRYEIRYLIGTAIAVAKGQIGLDFIKTRLDPVDKERKIVSYKAASKGLFLKEVIY